MTHASVFSGIGGPEVAATMLGWDNLFHCEINPFGRAVLDYWYPNAKSYDDITKTDFSEWRGKIDVLTGGFPCQPFSYAGQRRGAEDDRYLWPYMFKCIDAIRPTWVVAENVAGILTMVEQGQVSAMETQGSLFGEDNDIHRYRLRETFTLERICDDLERHGYAVQPVLVPACAVGAPHRRDRVFIVGRRIAADTCGGGQPASEQQGQRAGQTLQQQGGEQPFDGTCGQSGSNAPTDPLISGARTPGASGSLESHGCHPHQQPCQRRTTPKWSDRFYAVLRHAADTDNRHLQDCGNVGIGMGEENCRRSAGRCGYGCLQGIQESEYVGCGDRWEGFPTVSPVHRGNDGLPFNVDDLTLSPSKWRTEALKAYGNAIVPQVMYEIFRAIQITENQFKFNK